MNGRECESNECFKKRLGYCPFGEVCRDNAYDRFRKGVLGFNERKANFVKSFSTVCVADAREVKRS